MKKPAPHSGGPANCRRCESRRRRNASFLPWTPAHPCIDCFYPVMWLLVALVLTAVGGGDLRGPHHPHGPADHHHYRPSRDAAPKITQDSQLLRDTEHIREDMGDHAPDIDIDKMTPEELEFHYFKLHDFDNNTKLDGLEILHAIHHTVDAHPETGSNPDEDLEFYVELIDRVLAEDDLDNDGFLSYVEYVVGRQRDETRRQAKP